MATRTVEKCRVIDVNEFNEEGYLQPGARGTATWTRGDDGEEVASIGWRCVSDHSGDALRLSYTVPSRAGGESRDVSARVPIEWTPCHFGGERPWFRCPRCDDRVVKLYKDPRRDAFACRECQGLLYESQTYTSATSAALQRLDDAREQLEDGWVDHESLREFYDANQSVVRAFNNHLGALDERDAAMGGEETERDDLRMDELPPFETWADDLFFRAGGCPGGRCYGWHGRCTATAKSTGDRCRQPAIGEHGKCYYHGGAPGSGVGEEQVDRQAEAFREEIERLLGERSERMADLDDLLDGASG